MRELRIQVVTDDPALIALRPAWMALHEAARGTVFQSCEWLLSWWAVYGHDFPLRVLALWDGPRLAALLPLFLHKVDLKVCSLKRLRFLGEHETYGEYHPLILPGYEQEAAEAATDFLRSLMRKKECDCVDFNSLPAESPFMNRLLERLAADGFQVHRDITRCQRMMMPLPADTDTYFKSLSSHGRADIKRDERLLYKNGAVYEMISDRTTRPVLEDFFALHEREWDRKRGGGFFKMRKRFGEFLRLATNELMQRSAARLHFLMVDGRMIAASQSFLMNGRCVGYVSGCDLSHPLARYSPGKVLSSLCIRDAITAGGVEFDFLGGAEKYKRELGGRETVFSRAIIHEASWRSLKPALFLIGLNLHEKTEFFRKRVMRRRKRGRE